MIGIEDIFHGCSTLSRRAYADTRCDEDRLARAFERRTHCTDVPLVLLGVIEEGLEIVIERAVNDRIGVCYAIRQCRRILQVTAMHLRTPRGELGRPFVRSGEAEDVMTASEELGNDMRSHESRGASEENTHEAISECYTA